MKKNVKKSVKNAKKVIEKNKKPIIIGAIGAGVAALAVGLLSLLRLLVIAGSHSRRN